MPLYSYKCKECEHELEVLQRMMDPVLLECPECHKESLEKQISKGTSFELKGNGWFKHGTH